MRIAAVVPATSEQLHLFLLVRMRGGFSRLRCAVYRSSNESRGLGDYRRSFLSLAKAEGTG